MTVTDTHYIIGGNKYDRVSAVLSYGSHDYANVPERVMEEARKRGQQIHSFIDFYNKGLSFDTPEHLILHMSKYDNWFRSHVRRVIGSEMPVYSGIYKYAGRLDLLIENMDGEIELDDIKTTATQMKCHCAQVVAYAMAARETGHRVKVIKILYIDKNTGEIKPVELKEFRKHQNGWMCMLGNYRYNKAA